MNEDISIVTAFYDIGRANIKGAERNNQKYLDYFSFWAGLENTLIVYTSEDLKDKILAIREQKGLKDKTIIITKELQSFDEKALKDMEKTFENYDQSINRANPKNIECICAIYNYIMYLKPFFVCDAINSGLTSDKIMWLDFGFNHGDDFFTNASQFNFKLVAQKELDEEKINFFAVKEDNKAHLASIYFSMEVFLIGSVFYGNAKAWQVFKEHFKEALKAFLSFNIVDDDQILLLWCVRNYPKNYHVVKSPIWFGSLYYFIPEQIASNLQVNLQIEKQANMKYYKIIKQKFKSNFKEKKYLSSLKLAFQYFFYKFIYKKEG